MKEFIICAAIKLSTGKIYYGHRHNHCLDAINGELSWTMNRQEIGNVEKEQGFITSENRFVVTKLMVLAKVLVMEIVKFKRRGRPIGRTFFCRFNSYPLRYLLYT